jgi:hypothetical protein
MRVYIDESGYTGEDLNNRDQPFFTLSSLGLEEEVCEQLKADFFPGVLSGELKHSSLRRRTSRHEMVFRFLAYLGEHEESVRLAVYDKRFALIAKLVDFIIEPAFHWNNRDIYEHGGNIIFANQIYYGAKDANRGRFLARLAEETQQLLRVPSVEHLASLRTAIHEARSVPSLSQPLAFAEVSIDKYAPLLLGEFEPGSLDLALSAALTLMGGWRATTDDTIDLIHDASKNMAGRADIWQKLTDVTLEPQEVGWDRRRIKLPVGLASTRFERSENYAGLQLADVISGAFAYLAKWVDLGGDQADAYGAGLFQHAANLTVFNPLLPARAYSPKAVGAIGDKAGDVFAVMRNLLA